ncbi:hypothetical protein AGMMS50289_15800 [Betaproteobacteria bacterium]|nr:hypothetical protein AGMMS50289_15800 [Betaproteobacteria bacterium]
MNEDDFKEEHEESGMAYRAGYLNAMTMLELFTHAQKVFDAHERWTPGVLKIPDPHFQYSRGFIDALAPTFKRTLSMIKHLATSRVLNKRNASEIIRHTVREALLDDLRYNVEEGLQAARQTCRFDLESEEW